MKFKVVLCLYVSLPVYGVNGQFITNLKELKELKVAGVIHRMLNAKLRVLNNQLHHLEPVWFVCS